MTRSSSSHHLVSYPAFSVLIVQKDFKKSEEKLFLFQGRVFFFHGAQLRRDDLQRNK
jgi:hypothetical protein